MPGRRKRILQIPDDYLFTTYETHMRHERERSETIRLNDMLAERLSKMSRKELCEWMEQKWAEFIADGSVAP